MKSTNPTHAPSKLRRTLSTLIATGVIFLIFGALVVLDDKGNPARQILDDYLIDPIVDLITPPTTRQATTPTLAQPVDSLLTQTNSPIRSHDDHSQACQVVATKPVETVTKKVYKWKDENGITHYSDKPPLSGSSAIEAKVDRVIQRDKKFSISVEAHGAGIPPFLQDKIRISSERIYAFLTEPLESEQVKQADIRVHLMRDKNTFLKAYGHYKPGQMMPAGFYTSKTNEAFVLATYEPKQIQSIAIHETSHVIMAALYQRTPTWLNEGMAEYFEDLPTSVINNQYKLKTGWIRSLKRNGVLPLKQLFNLNGVQWKQMKPEQSYANAWSVVYYLMLSNQGQQALHSLLKTIRRNPCQAVSSFEVIDKSYPGGVKKLQKDLIGWLSKSV